MGDGGFELSKHYFDCVSAAGEAIIAYAALLRWRGLAISYASVLSAMADSAPASVTSLKRFCPPRQMPDCIGWQHDALGFLGQWSPTATPIQRDLLTTPEGIVRWNCLAPNADAKIQFAGRTFNGLGYVEHLYMTLAPWRLAIDALRWGRFLSPTDSVVWLQWRGPRPLELLFRGGEGVSGATIIDERGIAAAPVSLELSSPRILRDGSLATTALASVPRLVRLLPRSILPMRETKWLSRGVLQTPAGFSGGFAIHELVSFSQGAA